MKLFLLEAAGKKKLPWPDEDIKRVFDSFKGKYVYSEYLKGLAIELEHGSELGKDTDVTKNDLKKTAMIVIAHLKEDPKYYSNNPDI